MTFSTVLQDNIHTNSAEKCGVPLTIKDGEQDFTISTTGSMSGVRDALCQIRSRLAKLGVNKDTRGTVEIVLAEAMNNIVEHAYDIDNTGPLDVSARAGPNFLYFILQDQGNSLPKSTDATGKFARQYRFL